MAILHGKLAQITVNSVDLTSFCDNLSLSLDVDQAETTTFGAAAKTYISGVPGATFSLSGSYDPTASTGPASALYASIAASPVAVVYKPAGTATGRRTDSFNANVSNYTENSTVSDKVTFSCDLQVTGAVTFTTQ